MKKTMVFAMLALAGGVAFVSGCDSSKRNAQAAVAATKNAPATLEDVFTGKTPGGSPVRVYKIVLQAPNGEHLLMVVGDTSVPVSIKNASTIKIGSQELSEPSYLPTGNGLVFAAKTAGSQYLTMPFNNGTEFIDPKAPMPDPNVKQTFPMPLFKAKVSGQTLSLPALDKL
jgi:hypothetical protein